MVSLEQAVAAPYCSRLLQEAGARIIKIERPEGDFAEYDTCRRWGEHLFCLAQQRQRIDRPGSSEGGGTGLLKELIRRADIFLQNLKTGAAERLGFGYKRLRN